MNATELATLALDTMQTMDNEGTPYRFHEIVRMFAMEHGFKYETLRSAIRRDPRYHLEENGHRKLTNEQEVDIVCFIYIASYNKRPIKKKDIIRFVKMFFGIDVSRQFATSFLNRWKKELKLKSAELVTKARSSDVMLSDLTDFCNSFEFILEHYQVQRTNLVNVDETRIAMPRANFTDLKVISPAVSGGNNIVTKHDKLCLSVVPFICANGEVLCVFLVFKSKSNKTLRIFGDEGKLRQSPRTSQRIKYFYVATETGYVDSECFLQMCRAFSEWWKEMHPGLHCFLLADRLKAHMQPDLIREMMQCDVYLVFLAANTSHFAQPLDGQPFALLKKIFHQLVLEHAVVWDTRGDLPNNSVMSALYESLRVALRPKVIMASFKDRGIWPYNRELLIRRGTEWAGRVEASNAAARHFRVHCFLEMEQEYQNNKRKEVEERVTEVIAALPLKQPVAWFEVEEIARKKSEEKEKKSQEAQERKRKREEDMAAKKAQKEAKIAQRAAKKKKKEDEQINRLCKGGCGNTIRSKKDKNPCKDGSGYVCATCKICKK